MKVSCRLIVVELHSITLLTFCVLVCKLIPLCICTVYSSSGCMCKVIMFNFFWRFGNSGKKFVCAEKEKNVCMCTSHLVPDDLCCWGCCKVLCTIHRRCTRHDKWRGSARSVVGIENKRYLLIRKNRLFCFLSIGADLFQFCLNPLRKSHLAHVGPCTAMRGPTVADVDPLAFCALGFPLCTHQQVLFAAVVTACTKGLTLWLAVVLFVKANHFAKSAVRTAVKVKLESFVVDCNLKSNVYVLCIHEMF